MIKERNSSYYRHECRMTLAAKNHLEELCSMLFDFVKGEREIEEVTEVMTEDDEEFFGVTRQELREKANDPEWGWTQ